MAKEHEAGKRSITEILKFSTRELQQICKKIDTIKASTDVQKDKSALSNILSDAQNKFDRQWEDRKQMLTRHAKFRLHSAETDSLSNNLSDVSQTLKIRTSLEESLMSVNSASNFVAHLETTKLKVKQSLYKRHCPQHGSNFYAAGGNVARLKYRNSHWTVQDNFNKFFLF